MCPTWNNRTHSPARSRSSWSGQAFEGRAASTRRLGDVTDPKRFAARYPFELDDFQVEASEALDSGESVLVAAPTGSGKTVVAEFAVERALDLGSKAFYTTPLKALSNQKFGALVARYGAAKEGLLHGCAPDPPSALGPSRVPIGHDLQRGGVRRMDRNPPWPDQGGHRGTATGAARAPLPDRPRAAPDACAAGRRGDPQPVHRLPGPTGGPVPHVLPAILWGGAAPTHPPAS